MGKRLCPYLFSVPFNIFSNRKALEQIALAGDNCPHIQCWLEFLIAYQYNLEYRRGTANSNADFLSHRPQKATEKDASEAWRLFHPEDVDVYFVGASGLWRCIPCNPLGRIPILGGLLLVTPSSILSELHSDESLFQTTMNPNAEFSTNCDHALLEEENATSPFMVAPVSRHSPVELTLDRTRLRSARAAQHATPQKALQPPSVTESTTTPPRDDVGDPDMVPDLSSSLLDEDFHIPVEQLDHPRWAEEQFKDLTFKANVNIFGMVAPFNSRQISCRK